MEIKYLSLPAEIIDGKTLTFDNSLLPTTIKVMHEGVNLNKSSFSEEAIKNAAESLKNKPILGYIKKVDGSDEIDFAGHEFEIVINENGVDVEYLGRPLGVIPETNSYQIVEEDDKKYVVCGGYFWREYLNKAYKILKDNPEKSVSMEIAIDEYEVDDDGIIHIKAYRYLGVVVLGDDVLPGMEGAKLNVDFSKKDAGCFLAKIEDLNNKITKYFSSEAVNKGGGEVADKESMFATYNQKRKALREALPSEVVKDGEGNIIKETYYYIADFCDQYVYVERNIWEKDEGYNYEYGRFTYDFDEEKIEAQITSEFKKMILTWLTEEENKKIEDERKEAMAIKATFETLKEEHDTLKKDYTKLENETKELREFKAQKDKEEFEAEQARVKQEKIDYINTEYENISADIRDLFIAKVDEYETIEDIDADICVYVVKNKVVFSKTKKKVDNIKIGLEKDEKHPVMSPYGDLF